MSLITIIWSIIASACLTLALVHGLIWFMKRSATAADGGGDRKKPCDGLGKSAGNGSLPPFEPWQCAGGLGRKNGTAGPDADGKEPCDGLGKSSGSEF